MARADDVHELLGGELTFLIEIAQLRKPGVGSEEDRQVLGPHMGVPGRNIDHQRMGPAVVARGRVVGLGQRCTQSVMQHLANELFNLDPIEL